MATVENNSNFANEKTDVAMSSKGQLVGDKGGAVGGKDVEEEIRCNESMA